MYLETILSHVRLSLSKITSLFGLSRYLDRTFAQQIGSAKVKSKSEVTHCSVPTHIDQLLNYLIDNVLNETSYLHYLLKSQERSQDIVNRLRSSQTYEHYSVRIEKFKRSFIPFSVNNYQ